MMLRRFLILCALSIAALFPTGLILAAGSPVEHVRGNDVSTVAASPAGPGESFDRHKNWHVTWKVDKWDRTADFKAHRKPNRTQVVKENLLLNGGITEMLKLLTGNGGTAYSNANAYIVVGTSTTAASASQTDMQANGVAQAMDASYPTVSAQTATWRATYGSSDANQAWEEIGVKNGAGAVSSSILMLNRKVTSMGTKASGSTWVVTLTLTIS